MSGKGKGKGTGKWKQSKEASSAGTGAGTGSNDIKKSDVSSASGGWRVLARDVDDSKLPSGIKENKRRFVEGVNGGQSPDDVVESLDLEWGRKGDKFSPDKGDDAVFRVMEFNHDFRLSLIVSAHRQKVLLIEVFKSKHAAKQKEYEPNWRLWRQYLRQCSADSAISQ